MKHMTKTLVAAGLTAVLASGAAFADETIVLLSTSPGSPHNVFHTRLATVVGQHTDHEIQVSLGQTPVKMTVEVAEGKAELGFTAPTIVEFLKTQTAMYKNLANAKELYSHLRGVVSHDGGLYTFVVFEESGIKTMHDVKGKKLSLGNPGSAAQRIMTAVIEAETGYKPGVDYELSRLQSAAAVQSFQDGQIDLWASPAVQPNPVVEQFALTRDVRLIGVSEETLESPKIKGMLEAPGRYKGEVPPDLYGAHQANTEPTITFGIFSTLISSDYADEETIYLVTKTMWDNIEEIYAAGPQMRVMLTKKNAFYELNMPLHPGAYRYYREAGFDIPEDLIPPEVKEGAK